MLNLLAGFRGTDANVTRNVPDAGWESGVGVETGVRIESAVRIERLGPRPGVGITEVQRHRAGRRERPASEAGPSRNARNRAAALGRPGGYAVRPVDTVAAGGVDLAALHVKRIGR